MLGAQGVLAGAVVRAFVDARWRVVRGVRRRDGVGGSAFVDLDRTDTVGAAIAGVDLVVDPVPHPYLAASTITGAGNYRVTGAATLALAEALLDRARRHGLRPGCFEPQELFTLPELEGDLRRRGLAVNPVRQFEPAGR